MSEFYGSILTKMDEKNRVFIPASYRKSLERSGDTTLYLHLGHRNMTLYPKSVWKKTDEELKSKLDLWVKKDKDFYRQFTSRMEKIEVDPSGRILLPKKFIDTLEMEAEVLFVGMGEYMEIWKEEVLETVSYDEQEFQEIQESKMGRKPANAE